MYVKIVQDKVLAPQAALYGFFGVERAGNK
jgi:hypothetical protein